MFVKRPGRISIQHPMLTWKQNVKAETLIALHQQQLC